MQEIGSEYWISNLPTEYLEGSPEWINKWGNNVLTSSGRGAISLLLEQIENEITCKTVLLPAYTCESVIIPFKKRGYTCYFYDIDQQLYPKYDSINSFNKEQISIFLHMGYYGFSTNNQLGEQIKQFKNKGTIIIEDLTHTLFSYYRRFKENDYYIASLRKWTGLASGGFLASKYNDIQGDLRLQTSFSNIREEALLIKGQYIISDDKNLKKTYLEMFKEGESILDNDPSPYSIDPMSKSIIKKIDIDELIIKRKQNFKSLLEDLKDIKWIEPVFDELPDNICPFFFPIYIDKGREELKRKLKDENIYCPVHWPIPEQIGLDKSPLSKKIYENIMSLPCDQRYGKEEMQKIIGIIKKMLFS